MEPVWDLSWPPKGWIESTHVEHIIVGGWRLEIVHHPPRSPGDVSQAHWRAALFSQAADKTEIASVVLSEGPVEDARAGARAWVIKLLRLSVDAFEWLG